MAEFEPCHLLLYNYLTSFISNVIRNAFQLGISEIKLLSSIVMFYLILTDYINNRLSSIQWQ